MTTMTVRGVGITDNLSPGESVLLSTNRSDAACKSPVSEETGHTAESPNILNKYLTYHQRKNDTQHQNSAKRVDESTITSATSRTTKSSIGSMASESQRGCGSSRILHHRRRSSIRVMTHPDVLRSRSPSTSRGHGDVAASPPKRHCSLEGPDSEDKNQINEDKNQINEDKNQIDEDKKSSRKERSTTKASRRGSKSKKSSKRDCGNQMDDLKTSRSPRKSTTKSRRSKSLGRPSNSKKKRSSRTKTVRSLSYDKSQDEPTTSSAQNTPMKSPQSRRGSKSRRSIKKSILQLDPANLEDPSGRSMERQLPLDLKDRKSDKRRSKSNSSKRRCSLDSSFKLSTKFGKDSGKKKNGKTGRRQKGDEDDRSSSLKKSTKQKRKIKLKREEDLNGLNDSRHNPPSISSSRRQSSSKRRGSGSRRRSRSSDRNSVPERLTRAIDRSSEHGREAERTALAIFVGDDDDLSENFHESVMSLPTHLLDPSNIPLTLQW